MRPEIGQRVEIREFDEERQLMVNKPEVIVGVEKLSGGYRVQVNDGRFFRKTKVLYEYIHTQKVNNQWVRRHNKLIFK